MRKKVVRSEPFSPNVEKVYYADGTWGLRGNPGQMEEQIISVPEVAESPMDESSGEPFTQEDLADMEAMVQSLRPRSGANISEDEKQNIIPLPSKKGI